MASSFVLEDSGCFQRKHLGRIKDSPHVTTCRSPRNDTVDWELGAGDWLRVSLRLRVWPFRGSWVVGRLSSVFYDDGSVPGDR